MAVRADCDENGRGTRKPPLDLEAVSNCCIFLEFHFASVCLGERNSNGILLQVLAQPFSPQCANCGQRDNRHNNYIDITNNQILQAAGSLEILQPIISCAGLAIGEL